MSLNMVTLHGRHNLLKSSSRCFATAIDMQALNEYMAQKTTNEVTVPIANISTFYQNLHYLKMYKQIYICPPDAQCDVMCKRSIL